MLDPLSQLDLTQELATPRPSAVRFPLGDQAPIAVEIRQLGIDETVPPQLAEDGRAMTPKPARHFVGGELCLPPTLDLAPFRDGQMGKPDLHSQLLSRPQTSGNHEKSHSRIARTIKALRRR